MNAKSMTFAKTTPAKTAKKVDAPLGKAQDPFVLALPKAPVVVKATVATKPAKKTLPGTIQITKADAKFKGQRGEWFALLKANAGKTADEFYNVAKDRKGTEAWLRWFATRSGAVKMA